MNKDLVISIISKINENSKKFISDELKKHGAQKLLPAYGSVLCLLYANDGKMSMKGLADALGKSKSTVTDMIKRLRELGYVDKNECCQDGRVCYAVLTERGKNFQKHFDEISVNLLEKAYIDFTDDEAELLVKLLTKLEKNFQEYSLK